MRKVVLKWGSFSVLQKLAKASFVVSKMTTNAATFPTPDPPLSAISNAVGELANAENEASLGGKDRTLLRDQKLATLEDLMNQEVLYVQTITQGDEVLTAQAGMEGQDEPSKWPLPAKPENLRAKPGEFEGSVYLICNAVKYKKQYVFEMWVEDDAGSGQWVPIQTQGKRSYTHMGLERGKVYRFRVCAINSKGRSPYSDEAESPAG